MVLPTDSIGLINRDVFIKQGSLIRIPGGPHFSLSSQIVQISSFAAAVSRFLAVKIKQILALFALFRPLLIAIRRPLTIIVIIESSVGPAPI